MREERSNRILDAFNAVSGKIDAIYKALTKSAAHPLGGTAYLTLEDDGTGSDEPHKGGCKHFVRTGEKSAFHSEVMEKAMRHESRVAARRKQKQSSLSTPSKPDHNRNSGGGMVRLASELSFLSTTESL